MLNATDYRFSATFMFEEATWAVIDRLRLSRAERRRWAVTLEELDEVEGLLGDINEWGFEACENREHVEELLWELRGNGFDLRALAVVLRIAVKLVEGEIEWDGDFGPDRAWSPRFRSVAVFFPEAEQIPDDTQCVVGRRTLAPRSQARRVVRVGTRGDPSRPSGDEPPHDLTGAAR